MSTALPLMFWGGTVPQKRLSWLLSRLSPMTNTCPSGTLQPSRVQTQPVGQASAVGKLWDTEPTFWMGRPQ